MAVKNAGVRFELLELMLKFPKSLYSVSDMVEELKDVPAATNKNIENAFRTLRMGKKLNRHVNRDVNGDFQYAITIPVDKIEPWVLNENLSNVMSAMGGKPNKKRKGTLPTSKEIKSMFAAHFNNMAKLEDSVMMIIDRFEEMDKEMSKIRSFLQK